MANGTHNETGDAAYRFKLEMHQVAFHRPLIGPEEEREVIDTLRSGWITTGPKAKRFERVGPIEVSLRKTNARHQFCDLHLIVNDREVVKKHINVYEPVVFYTEQDGQPLQLVVNSISKNHMHGYLSAPKYQASRRTAANTSAVPVTSASDGAATARPGVAGLRQGALAANTQ